MQYNVKAGFLLTLVLKNVIFRQDEKFDTMKVFLSTLGCKLNESELEAWTRRFANEGHEIVPTPIDADICVVNTCTVTHVAARKSRQMARQIARANPKARLVLTGCYASIAPNEAKSLPNVALVVLNAEKERLVSLAKGILPISECSATAMGDLPQSSSSSRTRAFVKIQDGCNMSCSYCIIPVARGKERSRPMREIVSEIQALVDSGYKEIILTGVQISVYENDRDKAHGLHDLVSAILGETDVPRLRLTSIAPWDLDERLLDLFADPRLCRHLHLSLQSGSDGVLRRMRRPYSSAQFARAVALARDKVQDVGITTDVIVGFPGESDVEFEESVEFVERMGFTRVHIFPYSARASTVAASLPSHVSDATKESRTKRAQEVAVASARAFAQRFVGRTMQVLWENPVASNRSSVISNQLSRSLDRSLATDRRLQTWSGYTDNYIRVIGESQRNIHNEITLARLMEIPGYDAEATMMTKV
jgi:threonylcarbamoyladenosine tRNA methylthiotransferase MtaB